LNPSKGRMDGPKLNARYSNWVILRNALMRRDSCRYSKVIFKRTRVRRRVVVGKISNRVSISSTHPVRFKYSRLIIAFMTRAISVGIHTFVHCTFCMLRCRRSVGLQLSRTSLTSSIENSSGRVRLVRLLKHREYLSRKSLITSPDGSITLMGR